MKLILLSTAVPIVFLSTLSGILCNSSQLYKSVWVPESFWVDTMLPDAVSMTVRSRVVCAAACSISPLCLGFDYSGENCKLLDKEYEGTEDANQEMKMIHSRVLE